MKVMSHLDLLLIDLTQERSSTSKHSLLRNDNMKEYSFFSNMPPLELGLS